ESEKNTTEFRGKLHKTQQEKMSPFLFSVFFLLFLVHTESESSLLLLAHNLKGSRVYVGGSFPFINGFPLPSIARLNLSTSNWENIGAFGNSGTMTIRADTV